MSNSHRFFVADDNGTIYGHDLSLLQAEIILAYVIENDPHAAALHVGIYEDTIDE